MGAGAGRAESYDNEKAWSYIKYKIKYSLFSGLPMEKSGSDRYKIKRYLYNLRSHARKTMKILNEDTVKTIRLVILKKPPPPKKNIIRSL